MILNHVEDSELSTKVKYCPVRMDRYHPKETQKDIRTTLLHIAARSFDIVLKQSLDKILPEEQKSEFRKTNIPRTKTNSRKSNKEIKFAYLCFI